MIFSVADIEIGERTTRIAAAPIGFGERQVGISENDIEKGAAGFGYTGSDLRLPEERFRKSMKSRRVG